MLPETPSRKLPPAIASFLQRRERTRSDYFLRHCGRSIVRIRIAADGLDSTAFIWEADYHAYAGVSSAYTAVDTFSNWLSSLLGLVWQRVTDVGLDKSEFRERVRERISPAMYAHICELRTLLAAINPYRRPAIHREGLIVTRVSTSQRPQWTWSVWTQDQSRLGADFNDATGMLRNWADRLEASVGAAIDLAPGLDFAGQAWAFNSE
jgi:hypothetical protein